MRKLLAVLALSVSATAVAYASPVVTTQPQGGWSQSDLQAIDNWLDQFGEQFEDWFYATWGPAFGITDPDSAHSGSGGGTVAAPEFDPAEALAALTLLSGGLAVLRGRRSKR
ncbi:MAG TPA: hypothetical protein VGR92_02885 [Steroidobacteraceae bacterium]|nr:hypothetical protein [Steroidobacteraceae bacterium]